MDSISNMVIIIKNASLANKESASFPYSNLKKAIADCLSKEGYVAKVSKRTKKGFPVLEVGLVYVDGKPKFANVERISKPSRRVYFSSKSIFPVKNGHGLLVLSTPKGILSGKEAKKEQVGGEALFKIW